MIRADYPIPEIFQGQFIEDTNTNQNLVMSVFSKRLENFEKHVPTCFYNGLVGTHSGISLHLCLGSGNAIYFIK
jgi:hypothetical protein